MSTGEERSFALTTTRKNKGKSVYECKLEAHELTRRRTPETQNKDHEGHIAERGFNSMSHDTISCTNHFLCMLQAMNIPDAKAAVDKDVG